MSEANNMSGGKRVLLVEDELLLALDTQDLLTEAGYEVVGPATSLDAALAMAEGEILELAVLDINLAGKLVWPVAERLVARNIPIILLSGFGGNLDVPPALRAAPRLGKPVVARLLLDQMTKLAG